MEKKLTGRSFQERWLYCDQGAVLELQSCHLHWFLTSQAGLACHWHGGRNTDKELANCCLQQSKIMAQSWPAKLEAVGKKWPLKMHPGCSIKDKTEVSS